MTNSEIKKAVEIMLAYANGKEIECKESDSDSGWRCCNDPGFDWFHYDYRIKSEPKYRPFKNKEECWNEMLKHHPFGWLKSKKAGSVGLIGTLYTKDEVLMIIWATNEYNSYSSFDVFNDYVFTDGTLFGINEE